jgi:DNA-binding ferritin-like protein
MQTFKSFNTFLNENLGSAQNEFGTFFVKMLAVRDQGHIFHWQTRSYARHKAFGNFYEDYLDLVDTLAEAVMGIRERPVIGNATITLVDYSDVAIKQYLDEAYKLFTVDIKGVVEQEYVEIYNIIEEITALIDKLRYLLTLD